MRLPVASTAFAVSFALLMSGSAHAADVPPIVYDKNDNPIVRAAPQVRTAPVADAMPFDANDNPVPPTSPPPVVTLRRNQIATVVAPPPVTATPIACIVTARTSPNPLKASASALFRSGNRLYLGLQDGGVAFCDASDGRNGAVVRFPAPTLPVRAVTASHGVIWWVSGDGTQVFVYRGSERSVTAFTVAADGSAGWVQRIALLDGAVCLCGEGVTRILDTASGALRAPTVEDGLPADALRPDGRESLYIAGTADDNALVASVDPAAVSTMPRIWRSSRVRRNREWREIDGVESETAALPTATLTGLRQYARRSTASLPLDVESAGCAIASPTGLHLLMPDDGDSTDVAKTSDIPFGHEPGMPTVMDRFSVGKSGAWWLMRGMLFHSTADGLRNEAYLPWNSAKGAHVQALLPDDDGVFVALDKGGVRHLTPDAPSAADGYGGYVLVRLGDETCQPAQGAESDIATAIEDWQGVPYKWGGQTKTGTDCSGFVGAMHKAVGVTIPRSTSEMAASKQGKRIVDELHYGDVLVYPGHCALYIGDGKTAETAAAQVSKASIWRRTDVLVKRYLP